MADCLDDCPCRLYARDEDVVPYQIGVNSTDEELLAHWYAGRCARCFAWWASRVAGDGRYLRVIEEVKRAYPDADVQNLVRDLVVQVLTRSVEIRRPIGWLKKSLPQAAFRDVGAHRVTRVRNFAPEELPEPPETRGYGDGPDDTARIDRLKDCIAKLGPEDRRMIVAIYFEGRDSWALAKEQGASLGTFNKQVWRIRRKLRDCIERSSL